MTKIIKISWNEISESVEAINKPLHDVIDYDPKLKSSDLEIFTYEYGDLVGDEHFFYGPKPSALKFPQIPFSLVLKSHFEMPINLNGKTIPWKIYKPGDVFPYTRFIPKNQVYEPNESLSLRAGVSSMFMLINNISDKKWHRLLCNRYKIDIPPPKSFSEHYNVFKALSDSAKPSWTAELLVFPETFFQAASTSHDFKELIFNLSHQDKLFRRNIFAYEILLHKIFMQINSVTSSFVRDCIKHILYVGCGDLPAYFPTVDEAFAPISFLSEAYIHGYKSKSCPIMMVPDFLKPCTNTSNAYFSLNNLDYIFKPDKISSQAQIIRNIIDGFEELKKEITKESFSTNSILVKTAKNFKLLSIIKGEPYTAIQSDKIIKGICKKNALPLPENSTFLSSCIAMSYKKKYPLLD